MTTYLQHPPTDDGGPWPTPPSALELSHWEAAHVALPEDYKRFLIKYNGGSIYPSDFYTGLSAEVADKFDVDKHTTVSILFDWQDFLATNAGGTRDWQHFMLAIGHDIGAGLIGISTAPETLGSVVYWSLDLSNKWDLDKGPIPIGAIAPSFSSFLFEALHSEHGVAFRWDLPEDLETAYVVSL